MSTGEYAAGIPSLIKTAFSKTVLAFHGIVVITVVVVTLVLANHCLKES